MDFNQLKDLKSTWGENRTIVPEWVEGQSFYVVSDELLKQLINEINESRLLREQIAREQKEYLDHWQDFYLDTYPDDVIDRVGRDLIAIARGKL